MFLVTGATGGLGRRIVRLLRERELPVRAFVRLTSRYSELEHRGAQIFIGDLRREKDIRKACHRVEYVISTHDGDGDAQRLTYQANIDLIDQAKEAGVQHFVFISVLGADRGYEDAPLFKAKREVEKYLIEACNNSSMRYTILRPSGLASSLLPLAEQFRQTGVYFLIGDPKSRTSMISTDDLAQIAIDSVTKEGAWNQVFSVGGPDVLHREDIPRIFGRILNREPLIINPPLFLFDALRGTVGLFNSSATQGLGTFRTLLANEFFCTAEQVQTIESVYGMKMESLESFLRRYLGT